MSEENSIKSEQAVLETSDDASAQEFLREQLASAESRLAAMSEGSDPVERSKILLDKANALLGLEQNEQAWNDARQAFDVFIEKQQWPEAVEACDLLYQADQPASIIALAHGVWLSVTYPIDPEHSIVMLSYIVDETPNDSDGAAVAAATAHYLVGLRADDEKHDSLSFLTTNLIAKVAQRHSEVKNQEALNFWMEKLELTDPEVFLPRMSMVITAIIGEEGWWFDRDELRQKLPVN